MLTMFQVKKQTKESHELKSESVPPAACSAVPGRFSVSDACLLCSSYENGDKQGTSTPMEPARAPSGKEKDGASSKALHVDETMSPEVNGLNLLEDKAAGDFQIGV